MHPFVALFYAIAFIGHLALCAAFTNRVHAMAFPRSVIEMFNWIVRAWAIGLTLGLASIGLFAGPGALAISPPYGLPWALVAYLYLAFVAGFVFVPLEWRRRLWFRSPRSLRQQDAELHDFRAHRERRSVGAKHEPGRHRISLGHLLCHLPGNESLHLERTEKHLALPRLPRELDGLVIAHISDLHFTGRVPQPYFHEAIAMVGQMQPDLIAITGDIVEYEHCLGWIRETLEPLSARLGVYYILGNHDARLDPARIRRELDALGMINVGGSSRMVDDSPAPLVIAGNELPWLAPAGDLAACPPLREARERGEPEPFKLLLAHSPDQYPWARRHGFDLVLAGHTHGGQIVFPGVGPIVCPSRFGSRYASGTFHEGPTVMHVSRGLSGDTPLRWNCPPEITRLVLFSGVEAGDEIRDETPATATSS